MGPEAAQAMVELDNDELRVIRDGVTRRQYGRVAWERPWAKPSIGCCWKPIAFGWVASNSACTVAAVLAPPPGCPGKLPRTRIMVSERRFACSMLIRHRE